MVSTVIPSRVKLVSRNLDLTQEELGDLLNTSQRTVGRWVNGETTPQRIGKKRLLELAYIGEELARVLKPEDANLWLFSPNKLLKGDAPAALIKRGDFRRVLALIEALADGVVV